MTDRHAAVEEQRLAERAAADIRATLDELLRARSISIGEAEVTYPDLLMNMYVSHRLPLTLAA